MQYRCNELVKDFSLVVERVFIGDKTKNLIFLLDKSLYIANI